MLYMQVLVPTSTFETMFALARDGKTDSEGKPSMVQFASGHQGMGCT